MACQQLLISNRSANFSSSNTGLWGLRGSYYTRLKALTPYLPSTSNWSTWNYSSPTHNYHHPPPLYMNIEWRLSRDIGSQAPPSLLVYIVKIGEPGLGARLAQSSRQGRGVSHTHTGRWNSSRLTVLDLRFELLTAYGSRLTVVKTYSSRLTVGLRFETYSCGMAYGSRLTVVEWLTVGDLRLWNGLRLETYGCGVTYSSRLTVVEWLTVLDLRLKCPQPP